ncbi:MAG: glycosyltransferase [bacterium]|nr:glycosyltransferase [bacterium]
MQKNITLSVVLPVKDEGKRLAITLSDIHSYLKDKNIKHEIIAVISSGSDHSEELAKRLTLAIKELKVIILKEDRGKGYATKKGLKAAKHPWILIMNSDNSVNIVEIEKMFPYASDQNLVIGTKNFSQIKAAKEAQTQFGKIYKKFIKRWPKEEDQSGFKLFSKKLAGKILKESKADDRTFFAEILAIAKRSKIDAIEIPITWQETEN